MHTMTASLLLISYWMSVCCRQSKSSPFTLEGLIHTSQGRSCLISCQWGWWRGRVEGYRKGVRVWIMARHNMESQSFSFTTHTNDTIHDSKSDYSCDLTWWLLFNSFQSQKKKKKSQPVSPPQIIVNGSSETSLNCVTWSLNDCILGAGSSEQKGTVLSYKSKNKIQLIWDERIMNNPHVSTVSLA